MLIAPAFVSLGQARVEKRASSNFEANAIEANRAWVEGFAHCDMSALSKILADDCIITSTQGQVLSKDQLIGLMPTNQDDCTPENLAIDDVRVQSFGGTFIVTGRMTETYKGKSVGLRYTNVFIRKGGRLRLVTSQVTRVVTVSIELPPIKPPK